MGKFINKFQKVFTALLSALTVIVICLFILHGIFPRNNRNAVYKYSNLYNVDSDLVYSLIKAESNFEENAVSSAGAKGLMQLTDKTFCYFLEQTGITATLQDIFNADLNIHAGVWYISVLLDKYGGNVENAVAAYNAGPSNIDSWLDSPEFSADGKTLNNIPFRETERHIETVKKYKWVYSLIY